MNLDTKQATHVRAKRIRQSAKERRLGRVLIVATIALGTTFLFASCKKDKSDRVQIEEVFDAIEAGLETGKQSAVLAHIDAAYQDKRGDRKALAQYLFMLSRRGELSILRNQQDIVIDGTSATATIRALVMQGSGTIIPERADEFLFEVKLAKDDGWRVMSVERDKPLP